jgi:hypothetical protein
MQRNNQPNLYVASPGTQQLQNDNIVDLMMMPYIMLQEAMTTAMTVCCNKHAISHKQQPLFIDMDQPHQSLQRNKTPAIRMIAMPQCKQCQCDNHSLLSY